MIEWLRWVRLSEVGSYLAKGWTIRDDAATIHHGAYCCLLIWVGEGDPA